MSQFDRIYNKRLNPESHAIDSVSGKSNYLDMIVQKNKVRMSMPEIEDDLRSVNSNMLASPRNIIPRGSTNNKN